MSDKNITLSYLMYVDPQTTNRIFINLHTVSHIEICNRSISIIDSMGRKFDIPNNEEFIRFITSEKELCEYMFNLQ